MNKDLVKPNLGDDNGRSWLAVNEAGSGPYKVTKYKPTEEVVLEAFEGYWNGWSGNHVSKVVFVYISEPSTQLALLKSGDVHIAPDLTVDDKVDLKGNSDFKVDIGAAATPLYFQLNTQGKKLMQNSLFRKALVMAFDIFGKNPDVHERKFLDMGSGEVLPISEPLIYNIIKMHFA